MGSRNPNYSPFYNLGWLADNGYELAVHCPGCDRRDRVSTHRLARILGAYTHMDSAALRLKCRRCGKKGMEARRVKWDETLEGERRLRPPPPSSRGRRF